ncbi:amidase signature domain-containing protein [Cyathus striatus]|nr:amidase signature domain-containing protein [Cyathus striatus]
MALYDGLKIWGDSSLLGLPIAVKDNIVTSFLPTTCSSGMLKDFTSPFDATVVKLLMDAGADIIGKTNCDEFGMGSLNVHSIHGAVVNPFSSAAGGSSGGSAAAVASECVTRIALGTDTGGSVRLPASYCGVVGLKPSYGLVSRWGVVSYADSLDCVGVLASSVFKVKQVFDVISMYDDKDPTAALPDIRSLATSAASARIASWSTISGRLDGLRIGVPQEYFPSEVTPEIITHIRRIISSLKSRGATIVPVSLPSTSYALSAYYVLSCAEASSNLERYDGVQYGAYVKPCLGTDLMKTSNIYAVTRSAGFGREVQKRILLGTYALSADAFDNYFLQARRVRRLIKEDFNRVFSIPDFYTEVFEHNVLIHPSAICTAPTLDQADTESSHLDSYVQDILTVPASLAGLPAISVPVHNTSAPDRDGWPIGVSIVGQWGCDKLVMSVGDIIQNDQNKDA